MENSFFRVPACGNACDRWNQTGKRSQSGPKMADSKPAKAVGHRLFVAASDFLGARAAGGGRGDVECGFGSCADQAHKTDMADRAFLRKVSI